MRLNICIWRQNAIALPCGVVRKPGRRLPFVRKKGRIAHPTDVERRTDHCPGDGRRPGGQPDYVVFATLEQSVAMRRFRRRSRRAGARRLRRRGCARAASPLPSGHGGTPTPVPPLPLRTLIGPCRGFGRYPERPIHPTRRGSGALPERAPRVPSAGAKLEAECPSRAAALLPLPRQPLPRPPRKHRGAWTSGRSFRRRSHGCASAGSRPCRSRQSSISPEGAAHRSPGPPAGPG